MNIIDLILLKFKTSSCLIRDFWNVSKPDEICNVQFKQQASGIYNSVICINTHITVLAGRDNIVCTQGEKKNRSKNGSLWNAC